MVAAYTDVFSRSEIYVNRITLVEHDIPAHQGTKPIRQPPWGLGLEKDCEVEEQVHNVH